MRAKYHLKDTRQVDQETPELISEQDWQSGPERDSPGADPHERDGSTGEEDSHEEEGLPAPDV